MDNDIIMYKKSISLYNMGLGEALIVRDREFDIYYKLLIDFGSESRIDEYINKSITWIRDEFKIKSKTSLSLLISHFHKDHIKYVELLYNDSIDNIYIRNIYSNKSIIKMYFMILTSMYGSKTWVDVLNTLLFIPNMLNKLTDKGRFVFLDNGSRFSVGRTKFSCLSLFNNKYCDRLEKNIDEWFDKFIKDNPKLINLYNDIDMYCSFFRLICRKSDNNTYVINKSDINEQNINMFNEFKEKLLRINNKNVNVDSVCDRAFKFNAYELEHYYNIVIKDDENKLLLCGDMKKEIMNSILNNINDKISIVKVNHHGSKNFYSKSDYKFDIGLVSNKEVYYKYYDDIENIYLTSCTSDINIDEFKYKYENNRYNLIYPITIYY